MKVADIHCDTILAILRGKEQGKEISLRKNNLNVDLERMKKGDYLIQNFALFLDLENPMLAGSPFRYAMKMADVFYQEMEKNKDWIRPVTKYDEIEENRKNGKMSALLTLEEGEICEGDPALLRDFYRMGARMMTLTWNYPNQLGYPAKATGGEFAGKAFSEAGYGLTARGIEFLEEMENLGMIIDVAHLNDAGIRDVLKFTKKPFVASHSNARHLCSHPRNLNDELLKAIGERGGVIGLNYYAYFLRDWKDGETVVSRAEDIVAHAKYIRDMAGIEALGLGSDFDGMNGELEIASPADMTKLEEVFKKNGFTESEIEKIFCKNVMRIYRELLV